MEKEVDWEKGANKLFKFGHTMKDFTKETLQVNTKKGILDLIPIIEKSLEQYRFVKERFDDRAELKEILDVSTKAKISNYYDALVYVIFELKTSLKALTIGLENLKICGVCKHKHKELVDICENCGVEFF